MRRTVESLTMLPVMMDGDCRSKFEKDSGLYPRGRLGEGVQK